MCPTVPRPPPAQPLHLPPASGHPCTSSHYSCGPSPFPLLKPSVPSSFTKPRPELKNFRWLLGSQASSHSVCLCACVCMHNLRTTHKQPPTSWDPCSPPKREFLQTAYQQSLSGHLAFSLGFGKEEDRDGQSYCRRVVGSPPGHQDPRPGRGWRIAGRTGTGMCVGRGPAGLGSC